MLFSPRKSRPYQLSMAVVCTLLASGGFVAAGYADTSSADAAAASSDRQVNQLATRAQEVVDAVGFDSFAAQGVARNISFTDTLVLAKKPAAKQIFDLTGPNDNTPHPSRSVNAMRDDVPEISAELISQVRKDILTAAYQGLGHRYVWGGTSFENGWDCSGFVQWAYAQAGIGMPRTEQWMPMVETSNPQPGDIVVQNPDGPNHWSHIGIYVGNGKMISALNPSVGTLLHAPGDVSSSSAYFTMPGFAAADEKAKSDAAKAKTDKGASASSSAAATEPNKIPSSQPSTKPIKPGTTKPGTTAPSPTAPGTTKPGTTAPSPTAPGTTKPGTTAPAVSPSALPSATPKPTKSATTAPATPITTAPSTTAPSTTAPSTTAPSTTAPRTSAPGMEPPGPTAPRTTAPGSPSPEVRMPTAAPLTNLPIPVEPTISASPTSTAGPTAPAGPAATTDTGFRQKP